MDMIIKGHIKFNRLLTVVLLLLCTNVWAKDPTSPIKLDTGMVVKFHFREKSELLERDYKSNLSALDMLDTILRHSSFMAKSDSLFVAAGVSPDGNIVNNVQLAKKRAEAIKGYMVWRYPDLNQKMIKTTPYLSIWNDMIPLIESDTVSPYKTEILTALSHHRDNAIMEQQLREIEQGKVWSYIRTKYLPYFRTGVVSITPYYKERVVRLPIEEPIDTIPNTSIAYVIPTPSVKSDIVIVEEKSTPIASQPTELHTKLIRPIALKTNLLFDAATMLNIEVEVPVAKKWSIAGEYIFPWWVDDNKQNCLQVISGNLEVRYWFKPNYKKQAPSLGKHNPLTGWFVGLYGGGGYYDLEYKNNGYQGEFFIAAGISGGYVQPLSRNLSMEFSLGIGYMKTNYRHYEAIKGGDSQWYLIRQNDGTYTWIGPTRAKVSLIWYPNFKSNKKGGRR